MKKTFALWVLCLLLLLLMMTACQGNDPVTTTLEDTVTSSDTVTTAPDTTTAITTTEESNMNTLFPTVEHAEQFTVAKVFSSDMVLQRGEKIRVWGWAEESENGKKVSATFMGVTSEAVIQDGNWMITFEKTFEASAALGNSMKIYAKNTEVEFTDVLIGDVFMLIGQSNVAYSITDHLVSLVNQDEGTREQIRAMQNAPIRIHYNTSAETEGYPVRGTTEVCEDLVHNRPWQEASYTNLLKFSALGYFMAYHIEKATDNTLPIGIIEIDGNGLSLGTFMPNALAESLKTDTLNPADGRYYTTGLNNQYGSRYMYNHYMHPFANYALAGVVWYQGESDFMDANAAVFAKNFSALMTYLRSTHNLVNPEFPVFVVEFPSIYPAQHYIDLGKIRGIVGGIPQVLDNAYVSVSCDLWSDRTYYNNLHPNCKFSQGERLAKLALAVCNRSLPLEKATGPILESVSFAADGKSAVLTFTNCGEGLTTADGSTEVLGLVGIRTGMNLGAGLTAEITSPTTVTVTSTVSFRGIAYNVYASNFYGTDVNLCNSEGNPASAFWVMK